MSLIRKLYNRTVDVWDKVVVLLENTSHDPKWNDLLFRLEYLPNEVTYWTFHDNWHGASPISRACCWLGRHDYEAEKIEPATSNVTSVILFCMRCGSRKSSLCGNRQ